MEVKVRDLTMHYEEVGKGRPLLILHGWGLNGRMMPDTFEPLFENHSGWRRIYPDLPGHGKTPVPPSLRNHDDVIDILVEFIDKLAPGEHIVMLGVSWGGYLARAVVQRRLHQVDGVMLYGPAIMWASEMSDLPAKQVIYRDPAFAAALRPGEEWMRDELVVQTVPVLENFRTMFTTYGMPQDPAIISLLSSTPLSFDPDVLPEPCPAPALFLMGRQDHAVGYKDAWKVLDNYPRGTFAVLDRCGHSPFDQPVLGLTLMSEWLDRVEEYIAQDTGEG